MSYDKKQFPTVLQILKQKHQWNKFKDGLG